MVWAILVAVGVAIVSMTIFGARLTRRRGDAVLPAEEFEAIHDPDDPWSAWKPRPFEEHDRSRPRAWPVLAGITGLLLVGAGFAGARQTLWATEAGAPQPTAKPALIEVEAPPTPTPAPTAAPTPTPDPQTPAPTSAPSTPAPTQAPTATEAPPSTPEPGGEAPTVEASASCSGGTISATYSATANGGSLSYFSVFVDGAVAKGGPISGPSYSGSLEHAAEPGPHDIEVAIEDDAGRTGRKQLQATCG